MKTILLIIGLTASSVSAQNVPFVFHYNRVTNPPVAFPALGITPAYTVVVVVDIADVASVTDKGVVPWQHSASTVVSATTNVVGQATPAQKPQRPAPKVKGTNTPTEKIVTAVPPNVNTNSPAFRKKNHLPPFDK